MSLNDWIQRAVLAHEHVEENRVKDDENRKNDSLAVSVVDYILTQENATDPAEITVHKLIECLNQVHDNEEVILAAPVAESEWQKCQVDLHRHMYNRYFRSFADEVAPGVIGNYGKEVFKQTTLGGLTSSRYWDPAVCRYPTFLMQIKTELSHRRMGIRGSRSMKPVHRNKKKPTDTTIQDHVDVQMNIIDTTISTTAKTMSDTRAVATTKYESQMKICNHAVQVLSGAIVQLKAIRPELWPGYKDELNASMNAWIEECMSDASEQRLKNMEDAISQEEAVCMEASLQLANQEVKDYLIHGYHIEARRICLSAMESIVGVEGCFVDVENRKTLSDNASADVLLFSMPPLEIDTENVKTLYQIARTQDLITAKRQYMKHLIAHTASYTSTANLYTTTVVQHMDHFMRNKKPVTGTENMDQFMVKMGKAREQLDLVETIADDSQTYVQILKEYNDSFNNAIRNQATYEYQQVVNANPPIRIMFTQSTPTTWIVDTTLWNELKELSRKELLGKQLRGEQGRLANEIEQIFFNSKTYEIGKAVIVWLNLYAISKL